MPLASFLLVILAALIHATWNLLAKRAADGGPPFVFAYNLVACLAYGPWALWLVARGDVKWSLPVALCILASGAVHLAYSLALQRGYRVADLSVVYPVSRGTGPMLSSLAAFLLLGERATLPGVAGLVAVVGGILLIAGHGGAEALRTPAARRGVRWGGATGSLIAAYTLVDGYGVKRLGIAPVVLDWCSNLFRFLALLPLVLADPGGARAAMRGRWGLAVAVGLLSPLAYILVLGALQWGAPISLVAPARELSMLAGALLGLLVLGEPVGRRRLAGCALLAGGVVLLGLA